MLRSEEFALVATALAKAQGAFPSIPRDRKVTVKMKSGGTFSFKYAPLETILASVRPALAENQLALLQTVEVSTLDDGRLSEAVRTSLIHSSGQWFACDVPVFSGTGDNQSQAYASGVTYSRRYGVSLLLCLAADEDDDGNGGEQGSEMPDYVRVRDDFHQRAASSNRPRAPQRRSATKLPGGPADQGGAKQEPAQAGDDPTFADMDEDLSKPASSMAMADLFDASVTPGQRSLCEARAKAAGLDADGVLRLLGGQVIGAETIGDSLTMLKDAMDGALAKAAR